MQFCFVFRHENCASKQARSIAIYQDAHRKPKHGVSQFVLLFTSHVLVSHMVLIFTTNLNAELENRGFIKKSVHTVIEKESLKKSITKINFTCSVFHYGCKTKWKKLQMEISIKLKLLCYRPDLCLFTILSQRATESCLDFMAWFICWHAVWSAAP